MIRNVILHSRNEWLEKRKNRIGGSDAAALLGMNPYMSNVDLWKIKTGQMQQDDISEKSYVKYGTVAEKYLRELFALDFPQYEVLYEENNMWTNDKFPFAHASLDGWLEEKKFVNVTNATGDIIKRHTETRKGIWECKTSTPIGAAAWKKWGEGIPQNYYCQVLWYLGITEFDFVELTAQLKMQNGNKLTKHYHIERAEVQQDIDYIFEKAAEFWKCVETGKEPALILPEL